MRQNCRSVVGALLILFTCACGNHQPAPSGPPSRVSPPNNHINTNPQLSRLDKSPMDMIYCPADYPILKMSGKLTGDPVARVIYSRPFKDSRPIFGNVVKYGSYWRLGANESTEIEFFRDVMISGGKVRKGRYIMYCIPQKDSWTIKLNSDLYTWGLKVHDSGDLYSFTIPVTTTPQALDIFTMEFENADKGAKLVMGWDSTIAVLPINYMQ